MKSFPPFELCTGVSEHEREQQQEPRQLREQEPRQEQEPQWELEKGLCIKYMVVGQPRTSARETLDQHMEGSHTLRHSTKSQPAFGCLCFVLGSSKQGTGQAAGIVSRDFPGIANDAK